MQNYYQCVCPSYSSHEPYSHINAPLTIPVENDLPHAVTVTWGSISCDPIRGCKTVTIPGRTPKPEDIVTTIRITVPEAEGAWVGVSFGGKMCKKPVGSRIFGTIKVSTIDSQCKVIRG